jgi:hypothetical protein
MLRSCFGGRRKLRAVSCPDRRTHRRQRGYHCNRRYGAVLAVKKATSTVPVVMAAAGDPVGTGIVPNLARPGNITGLSGLAPDLEGKRLELLREIVPACATSPSLIP